MYSTILSGAILGAKSYLVQVEVDMSQGLPCFIMVGSLGREVKESAERVRIALKNRKIYLPPMHIAVNISPADKKKEGTGFDLPIAVALLVSMKIMKETEAEKTLFLGELGLNGEIKPVRGVLPIVREAREKGLRRCIIPKKNVKEAKMVQGIEIIGLADLEQLFVWMEADEEKRIRILGQDIVTIEDKTEGREKSIPDFSQIAGQESAKRAALIAAGGFHNLLLAGPPGAGKSMMAKCMPGILPPMTQEESLEVSSIYSVAGLLNENQCFITERPFLNPHHTISPQALTGGGQIPKPGVISLAHRGVLFLDELPEFKRQTIDLLRQPLEDRKIQIVRSQGSFAYPADFMLMGAMNPCPCGYFPDRNKCRCTPHEIHRYLSHVSGPILDRIDLCVEVNKVDFLQLQSKKKGESGSSMRDKVMVARKRQEHRYRNTGYRFNGDLKAGKIEEYCLLGEKERKLVKRLFQSMDLSARAYHKMLKVARTIADIEDKERIGEMHLAEASCYMGYGKEMFEGGK